MSDPKDSAPPGKARSAALYGLALALSALAVAYGLSRGHELPTRPNDGKRKEVRSYAVGYGLALALTCAAFATVRWPTFESAATLAVVFGLALVQMVVHFRFFLHVSLRKSARDDLQLILFSTLIVAMMVSGTLVILFNLRTRMM